MRESRKPRWSWAGGGLRDETRVPKPLHAAIFIALLGATAVACPEPVYLRVRPQDQKQKTTAKTKSHERRQAAKKRPGWAGGRRSTRNHGHQLGAKGRKWNGRRSHALCRDATKRQFRRSDGLERRSPWPQPERPLCVFLSEPSRARASTVFLHKEPRPRQTARHRCPKWTTARLDAPAAAIFLTSTSGPWGRRKIGQDHPVVIASSIYGSQARSTRLPEWHAFVQKIA